MNRLADYGLLGRRRRQPGSAALEVLLMFPFILLIWMLVVNMGYNGMRYRMAQEGLRLGAFQFVAGRSTMTRDEAAKAANATVNQATFPGEETAAKLAFSGQSGVSGEAKQELAGVEDDGLLSKASSRVTVSIAVTRDPPYGDLFPRTEIQGRYVVASNTWTYCEMKDADGISKIFGTASKIEQYGLWLFGGCGGKKMDFSCDDRCPQ